MNPLAKTEPWEHTRRERMYQCWQRDTPLPEEFRRIERKILSQRRFAQSARDLSLAKTVLGWVAVGSAVGMVMVSALSWFQRPLEAPPDKPIAIFPQPPRHAHPSASTVAPFAEPHVRYRGRELLIVEGLRLEIETEETAVVVIRDQVENVTGPAVLEFHSVPETVAGFRVERATPKSPVVQSTPHFSAPVPSVSARQTAERVQPAPSSTAYPQLPSWQSVAQALRIKDYGGAEALLTQLSKSTEVATSDAAELTLAELLRFQGRNRESDALLERLARSGSSVLVRTRAEELLSK